jgi:hypothetical protein
MPDEREQIAVDEETDAAEPETEEPEPEEEIASNESTPASTANAASVDQADNPDLTRYENLLRRELYDFARCTVTVTLQLLPDDGDPAGRPVVLGVQDHGFAPSLRFTRLGELALPAALTSALDLHADGMAEREQQYRHELEAAQKQRAEAEARRKPDQKPPKSAKSKAKKVAATDLPAPTPPSRPSAQTGQPAGTPSSKLQQGSLFGL